MTGSPKTDPAKQGAWRLLLFLAAGVLALLVVTFLLERLFAATGGQSWSLAVQAAATLALVVITGWYAYVTFRLLRIQERPLTTIRLAAQEAAVRKLGEILANQPQDVNWALTEFPLNTAGKVPPDFDYISKGSDVLTAYSNELFAVAPGLPEPMAIFAADTVHGLFASVTSMRRLLAAAYLERNGALKAGNREPTWEGIRSEYLTNVRQGPEDPEWEELVKGTQFIEAYASLRKLHGQVATYLHRME